MDAATPGATITASGGLTKANLIATAEAMNNASIPMGDNRMLVISPAALTDMMSDTTLVSSDYVANQGLQTGYIPNIMGFNIIVSNLLTLTSGVRACYAFDRDSIGCAIGKDITSRFDYVPQKVAHLVTAEFTQGCAVIDTAGLIQVDVTE
jgi:hypothetical protein